MRRYPSNPYRSFAVRFLACCVVCSVLVCCGATFAAEPNTLTPDELAGGWISLFDGESLFGWKAASKAGWKVVDGAIRVTSGEPGLLHTTTQFADYELKLDFRAAKGTNSGVFLRTSPRPKSPTAGCYELNITHGIENPFPTGSFVGRKKAADVSLDAAWHTFHVIARGGDFRVNFDGRTLLEFRDDKPLGRGFIGLQLNQGQVEFKNIKLKPLGLAPIFNGKDLTGWKIYPGKKSKFSVADGELVIRDGPGQLETQHRWADFVLQTEVFVQGKELNSGIFFRSIPGDFSNGYESQIHNGFKDGDRNQPSNAGTGGIFRRQAARRVVADDFKWFHKTILCEGKHMGVWVNGFQVSDWTDKRPPHENPRRGLRLAAGTFILQGHDPTTHLKFRNMAAKEMPRRR